MSKPQQLSTATLLAAMLATLATQAQARPYPLEAGAIANDQEAQQKCTYLAKQNGVRWTGEWWSIASGGTAVCQMEKSEVRTKEFQAGQIANAQQANSVCGKIAMQYRYKWTGRWRNTGQSTVCELDLTTREIDAGVIRNQNEANARCQALAKNQNASWTGQWRIAQGNNAVCQLKF